MIDGLAQRWARLERTGLPKRHSTEHRKARNARAARVSRGDCRASVPDAGPFDWRFTETPYNRRHGAAAAYSKLVGLGSDDRLLHYVLCGPTEICAGK